MNLFKKFIHSLTSQEARVLGRWNLEKCAIRMNHKVDWANEDHCGVCAQYKNIEKEDKNQKEIEEYIKFMM